MPKKRHAPLQGGAPSRTGTFDPTTAGSGTPRQEQLALFPATGWAAMAAGELIPFCTWSTVRALDPRGSGRVGADAARNLVGEARGLTARSTRRIFAECERRGYWRSGTARDGSRAIFLVGIARLMVRLGVERERAPRLVPLDALRTPPAMRGALYAAVHEIPGHAQRFRNAPLARATKAALTGVAPTSQRRYDRRGATELIQRVVVKIDTDDPAAPSGGGFYIGQGGVLYRRLPDYRVPTQQRAASVTAAKHATRKACRLREVEGADPEARPLVDFRGQRATRAAPSTRPRRSFFAGATEAAALKRAWDERARGRVTLGWGLAGEMEFREVELGNPGSGGGQNWRGSYFRRGEPIPAPQAPPEGRKRPTVSAPAAHTAANGERE